MSDVATRVPFVLLEERFESEDPRFLDDVLGCTEDGKLKALATKWYRDRRPWARRQLIAYVDDGCDRPRHRALVKALLRLAEDAGDDALMAHFLCAFDRLDRRTLKVVQRYDWYARETRLMRLRVKAYPDPAREWSEAAYRLQQQAPKGSWHLRANWFHSPTRQYLRRRAYRWFRQLAYREPERYVAGVLRALPLYRDEHLPEAINVLDVYGLTNLLYYGSDVLSRDSRSVRVARGRQLAELTPAPRNPDAWRGQSEPLLRTLLRSDCLFVRRWIVAWLEREEAEALAGIDGRKLQPLLLCPYPDVQVFAASLLEKAEGLGKLAVSEWLELLSLDNPDILPTLCGLVKKLVTPDRLDFEALVKLASARPLPVAELGLEWLLERAPKDDTELHVAMTLADAPCEPVREKATAWLLGFVTAENGKPEHLRDLLDARHANVRALALDVLAATERFRDDAMLWAALAESPYPDAQHFLVAHLEAREGALDPKQVEHLWATTLLSVHRGFSAKRRALRQISHRVVKEPERADALLPILRVALRSVREAERRSALAAVSRAAFESPSLRDAIARHIPELSLFPETEARA